MESPQHVAAFELCRARIFCSSCKRKGQPLTCDELRRLRDRFGSDPLSRLLLWEIARLRNSLRLAWGIDLHGDPLASHKMPCPYDKNHWRAAR